MGSASDVPLSKLRWYRLGGEVSDRQWRDRVGVARAQTGRLELDYLRRWSKVQATLDLLERVLTEASG